jgi:hypothetical protein
MPYIASVTMVCKKYVLKMPCMPTMNSDSKWFHREKLSDDFGLGGLAAVARSVKPKEMKLNKKALAALYEKLERGTRRRSANGPTYARRPRRKAFACTSAWYSGFAWRRVPSFPRAARDESTKDEWCFAEVTCETKATS